MPKFSKGHNSVKIRWFFLKIKSGNILIIPYQLTKFQAPSSNTFWDILLTNFKKAKFSKGHNSGKIRCFFFIYSGNLLIIPYQLTKFQAPSSNTFRDILLTRFNSDFFKMPKFSKGHYSGKIRWILLNFNQVIYSSSPISWPSFKPLAQILFEISCWQDFTLIFSKGHNSRKGDNSDKKKYTGQLFFHEESIFEISKS